MAEKDIKMGPTPGADAGGNSSNASNGNGGADPMDAAPQLPEPTLTPAERKLRDQLAEWYMMIGMMIVAPIDRLAGHLLVQRSEDIATQWIILARTNPAITRALKKLLEASGWAGIAAAHGMILLPVLANRGMFPDQFAGGIVAATVAQEGLEVLPLFDHERFRQEG